MGSCIIPIAELSSVGGCDVPIAELSSVGGCAVPIAELSLCRKASETESCISEGERPNNGGYITVTELPYSPIDSETDGCKHLYQLYS